MIAMYATRRAPHLLYIHLVCTGRYTDVVSPQRRQDILSEAAGGGSCYKEKTNASCSATSITHSNARYLTRPKIILTTLLIGKSTQYGSTSKIQVTNRLFLIPELVFLRSSKAILHQRIFLTPLWYLIPFFKPNGRPIRHHYTFSRNPHGTIILHQLLCTQQANSCANGCNSYYTGSSYDNLFSLSTTD